MLCLSCRSEIISQIESRCYLCNALTVGGRVCKSCRSDSSLRRVWWLGGYNKVIKELVHIFKFQRKRAYAREFGVIMADTLPYLPDDTIVVSVPTAATRVRVRGYDQAALIAQSFAAQRNLVYKNILLRTSQVDQIGKDRAVRRKQMLTSVGIKSKHGIAGRSILLVDDVLTTGASLEASARLLRRSGAKHVDAVVVARHIL
jgi:ComF family protein